MAVSGVALLSGVADSDMTPVSGAAVSGVAPVSGVAASGVASEEGLDIPPQLLSKGNIVLIRNRKRAFLLCACTAVLIYLDLR